VYKHPFYQIVEWNLIEKSIRQRESNRIDFSPESECSTADHLILHHHHMHLCLSG